MIKYCEKSNLGHVLCSEAFCRWCLRTVQRSLGWQSHRRGRHMSGGQPGLGIHGRPLHFLPQSPLRQGWKAFNGTACVLVTCSPQGCPGIQPSPALPCVCPSPASIFLAESLLDEVWKCQLLEALKFSNVRIYKIDLDLT